LRSSSLAYASVTPSSSYGSKAHGLLHFVRLAEHCRRRTCLPSISSGTNAKGRHQLRVLAGRAAAPRIPLRRTNAVDLRTMLNQSSGLAALLGSGSLPLAAGSGLTTAGAAGVNASSGPMATLAHAASALQALRQVCNDRLRVRICPCHLLCSSLRVR
jgi:hypothetical protein